MSSPSWTSLPPASLSDPPRLSQSTGLSSLSHTANSHWLSTLHMIVYMFPCYFLHLSYTLLPPDPHPCPQVCSLCLCLHCCPAGRFISTVFLDSISLPLRQRWHHISGARAVLGGVGEMNVSSPFCVCILTVLSAVNCTEQCAPWCIVRLPELMLRLGRGSINSFPHLLNVLHSDESRNLRLSPQWHYYD